MIIGIVGFIGTGKSTIGRILETDFGYQSISFASNLKDAVSDIFGWPRELLEGNTSESRKFRETIDKKWSEELKREITPRLALQLMGTEAGRNIFGQNVWVYSTMRKIENSDNPNWVITDCRFSNEMDSIRKRGGKIIHVKRGLEPVWLQTALETNARMHSPNSPEHMTKKYPDIHISEWGWVGKSMDAILHNNSTEEELRKNVRLVLKHFNGSNSELLIVGSRIGTITS